MSSAAGITAGFLRPNQVSTRMVSTGRWSLSSRSNVPFVQLIGKGVNKIFSWGEVVEVPEGEICTLKNVSYHAGDVWLNNGWDFDNRPTRITVPVPYNQTSAVPTNLIGPEYPADVRMARRAYVYIDAQTPDTAVAVYTIGRLLEGSHNTENTITIPPFSGVGAGYQRIDNIPIGQYIGAWPLGQGAVPNDDTRPMALLTTALAWFQNTIIPIFAVPFQNAYYVMEY